MLTVTDAGRSKFWIGGRGPAKMTIADKSTLKSDEIIDVGSIANGGKGELDLVGGSTVTDDAGARVGTRSQEVGLVSIDGGSTFDFSGNESMIIGANGGNGAVAVGSNVSTGTLKDAVLVPATSIIVGDNATQSHGILYVGAMGEVDANSIELRTGGTLSGAGTLGFVGLKVGVIAGAAAQIKPGDADPRNVNLPPITPPLATMHINGTLTMLAGSDLVERLSSNGMERRRDRQRHRDDCRKS